MTRLLLALCLILPLAAGAQPQAPSRLVTLYPSTVTSAGASGGTGSGAIVSGFSRYREAVCTLNITAISGTTPTIAVHLFIFPDDVTPVDYASFPTTAGSAAQVLMLSFSNQVAGRTPALTTSTLGAAVNGAGPIGDKMQVQYTTTGTATPTFTFSVTCRAV
jgi:hypothetical protein